MDNPSTPPPPNHTKNYIFIVVSGREYRILSGVGRQSFTERQKFLAPHPKLADRWGARGSGGVLTIHCYF